MISTFDSVGYTVYYVLTSKNKCMFETYDSVNIVTIVVFRGMFVVNVYQ